MKSELEAYRDRLSIAVRAADICVYEVDLKNRRYTFFENAEAIFGKSGRQILEDVGKYAALPPEEYRRAVSGYFAHPDDEATIAEAFSRVLGGESTAYEARMRYGNGKDYVWCKLNAVPVIEDGEPVRMVGVISNIRDVKQHILELEDAANRDSFTGLYSKRRCMELCDMILSEDLSRCCAFMEMDLDGFKEVNDTYGHIEGDSVLLAVAKQIKSMMRKTDIVARFGGDEFIIVMFDTDEQQARQKALKLLAPGIGNGLGVTKSIGIAIRRPGENDFQALFKRADMALYRAKQRKNAIEVDI